MSFENPSFEEVQPAEEPKSVEAEKEVASEPILEEVKSQEKIDEWSKLENFEFNPSNYYRIVGENGYKDFLEKGFLRSSPTGTEAHMIGNLNIGGRPTSFPSFSKGVPDSNYLKKGADSYIFETDAELLARGEINPVTGKEIGKSTGDGGGRHWAYRAIDEKTGQAVKEMPASMIKSVYRVDKDGNLYLKKDIPVNDVGGTTP